MIQDKNISNKDIKDKLKNQHVRSLGISIRALGINTQLL